MRVHAITTWDTPCGIAEYALHLQEACVQQSLQVSFTMDSGGLDPADFWCSSHLPDVLWLNYHLGLHSRWTPAVIARVRAGGTPVVLTLHDTYETNTPYAHALCAAATAVIIHEPCADLEGAWVLRQGVPDLQGIHGRSWQACGWWDRPVLGTVGFPFPWKNYDRLAELTVSLGWGLLLIAPRATEEECNRWKRTNPWMDIFPEFLPAVDVPMILADCTATAFMYECSNSGTSGAIRQGIAARRPVYALETCRQFRDLRIAEQLEESQRLIRWVDGWAALRHALKFDPFPGVDPAMVYLAERDSWRRQARAYLEVFTRAIAGGRP